MNLLALDTSTEWLSLAVAQGDVVHAADQAAGQRHAELTLPGIDALLQQAGLTLAGLDALVYGAGPGSFTGLRIGCGIAQGLAYAAGLPVLGISTLQAMAEQCAAGSALDHVYTCLDARAGELYCAAWVRLADGGWAESIPPTLARPDAVPLPDGGCWWAVGGGLTAYDHAALLRLQPHLLGHDVEIRPTARAMLRLAVPRLQAGQGVPAAQCAPFYLRDKVALTIRERQA